MERSAFQTGCYILVTGNGNVVFLTVHAERGCGRAGQLTTNQTANGGRIQTEARRILAVDLNGNTRGLLACRGLNIDGIRQALIWFARSSAVSASWS